MTEGEQYFVNRLTFAGNTTTRDNVIRREVRLLEGGAVQHRSAQVQRQAPQSARLLQAARRGAGRRRPEDARREEPGRRHAEARGAEPQPADLRRRRVAVRRLLRPAVVPDLELPGPRRVADGVAAGRLALGELPGRVHRAVPVRPQHHRRHRRLQAHAALHRPVHAGGDRRQPHDRLPAGGLLAHVRHLQLRSRQGVGPEPDLLRARAGAAQSVPARFAAARRGRPPHHQQGDAELRPQHRRQSDLPELGHAPHRLDRLRGHRRQHQLHQAARRIRALQAAQPPHVVRLPRADRVHPAVRSDDGPADYRDAVSWAASTRSAASTSARSVRAIRKRASCSAATRRCCSTPST